MPSHGCADTPFDLGRRPWPVATVPTTRHPAAVDVWRVHHDRIGATTGALDLLDRAERARADHYRRAEHRRRFVVGRAGLRIVLARHGGATPDLIDLEQRCPHCRGAHGPVVVRGPAQMTDVHVSVTHATRWTIVAIARGRAVGVDVEPDDADVTGITELAATAAERRALRRLPDAARRTALLEMWTCKEAYLKGLGTGLLTAPDTVDVLGGGPVGAPARASAWHLHLLTIDPTHHGALAVDGAPCTPRLWTLDPRWASA